MVTDCIQSKIPNHELLCFFEDRVDTMMRLRLEEDDHSLIMKDGDKVIARWNAATITMDEVRDTANSYAENNHSTIELRMRHFWKQHPRAKFSLESIAGSIDSTKTNLRNRIKLLIDKGILQEQHDGLSTIVYCLNSDNEQTQKYIKQLDNLCNNNMGILGQHSIVEAVLT